MHRLVPLWVYRYIALDTDVFTVTKGLFYGRKTMEEKKYNSSYDRDTWMEGVLYLNGSGYRISSHADENDRDRWTGKRHYAAGSSPRYEWYQRMPRTCSSEGNWSAAASSDLWWTRREKRVECPESRAPMKYIEGCALPRLGRGTNVAQTRHVAGLRQRLDIFFVSWREIQHIHRYLGILGRRRD